MDCHRSPENKDKSISKEERASDDASNQAMRSALTRVRQEPVIGLRDAGLLCGFGVSRTYQLAQSGEFPVPVHPLGQSTASRP